MMGHAHFNSQASGLKIRVLSRSSSPWFGYAGFLAIYSLVFSQWQADPMPMQVHLMGVFVAGLCLFPLTLWTALGSRGLPAFELVCLAYLLAFSSPLYLQANQIVIFSEPLEFDWDDTYRTLFLVAIGIFAFISGYYLLTFSKIHFRTLRVDLPLHPKKRPLFIKLAFTVGFTFVFMGAVGVNISGGVFGSIVSQTQNLVYIAIVILGYRVLRKEETARWGIVLYSAVILSALLGLASGMLEAAIIPLLLLVVVRWNVSRRTPIALLVGGLCLFTVLNSVKGAYRSQVWTQDSNLGVAGRVGVWADLSQGVTSGSNGAPSSFEEIFRNSMSRFDLLHQFVWVQQMTPRSIPYYEGKTYGYLVYGWIPRFIWPDKPIAQEANVTFAVDYRLMSVAQTATTMIGIGHLPEAYANFGVSGIVLVMALQGMFLAAINKMLNGPNSEGGKAIYLSIMIFFLNGIGSATASLFMSIPLTILVSSIVLRFFATGWRATPMPRRQLLAFTR